MIRLKRFCGKFTKVPPRFEGVTGQVRFPTALALGSPAITKFLGQNDTFVFLSSLQQMAFASQRFFGPQTVFFKICWSHNFPRLFGQMAVASESSSENVL